MTLAQLRLQRAAKAAEAQALLAKPDEEMSGDDLTGLTAIKGEIETLDKELDAFNALADLRSATSAPAVIVRPAQVIDKARARDIDAFTAEMDKNDEKQHRDSVKRARTTSFKGATKYEANKAAYDSGMWLFAALGNDTARSYCKEQGIALKAASEGSNAAGGYLVPDVLDSAIIDLREMYGVGRQWCKMSTMTADTKSVPRRTGGLTAYFVGENSTITDSSKTWDRVTLTAKKLAVLAKYSSELNEDAIIDIANDLAGEISYAFAAMEDDCLFNGDGTSTYGGIIGVNSKIKSLSGTIANIAGLVVASGNAYSEAVLTDFEAVVAKLPQYADTNNARWFVHRSYYWNVMIKLMLAAGGVTEAEISGQGRNIPFLGYPVAVSQKQPSTEANSQVCALFGDMSKAVLFGDRRQITIAASEHLNFAEDELAIRGTQRFDVVVHDVGNASATAGLRVPGPIVGLITAAS